MKDRTDENFLVSERSGPLVIKMTTDQDFRTPIFLTGNFNQWRVADERFRLEKTGEKDYTFRFADVSKLPEKLEYKFVRVDWDGEETDARGNPVPNRVIPARSDTVRDHVPRWKTRGMFFNKDLLPQIEPIKGPFQIPRLIRTRRISALLPHDYYETDRHYPVLYLQDGQNLFDDYAPYGNWAVDKKLAILAEGDLHQLIIVAIDHAEEERIREFTPSTHARLGAGTGKQYVRFLADVLKPLVDQKYRTLPGREHTGIGGSSMGGLISLYAGLMYPEVYGKLMIFSPALWVAPNIHFHAIHFQHSFDTQIYLYAGKAESENMVPNLRRFRDALNQSGQAGEIEFELSIDPEGQHNETRWGEEFPRAIEWLFFRGSPKT